ncbi:Receptor-interacting serine/threonine-protein kinase 3 [Blastocladiella emersonii ATCC 22665]|nr:Receptor-interacting serine/threonine-protein kinase 3 [Blastocladiella emersonii ATCC 22665]
MKYAPVTKTTTATALDAAKPSGALVATAASGELAASSAVPYQVLREETLANVATTFEKLDSKDARALREQRKQRATFHAHLHDGLNHSGIKAGLAMTDLTLSLICGPFSPKNAVTAAFGPYVKLWNRLYEQFATTLDLANEIERRAIDLIELSTIVLDVYADRTIVDLIGAVQRSEIVKLIRTIEEKVSNATAVLERIDQSSSLRMMATSTAGFKFELGQINATITSAQAQLHAHITSSMAALLNNQDERIRKLKGALAIQNAALKDTGNRLEEIFNLARDLCERDVVMGKELAELLAVVEKINFRAGFWADIKNPEVASLWDTIVGKPGGMTCTDNALITLADLGYTSKLSADHVSVHALNALFPDVLVAQGRTRANVLLGWRAYSWVRPANWRINRIADLARRCNIFESAARRAHVLALCAVNGLKAPAAWNIMPELEGRLNGAGLSPAVTNALPPKYATFIHALMNVEKALKNCYTVTAEPASLDNDTASRLATDFTARFSKLQDVVVAAAVALGLPAEAARQATWTPHDVESCTAKAQRAFTAQLEYFDTLGRALDDRSNDTLASLAGLTWGDVGAAATRAIPWGNATLFEVKPVVIVRVPANVAPAAIINLAGLHACASANVLRVYGVLPPTPATRGDWAVVVERFNPHVVFDELDLQSKLAAAEDLVRAAQVIHGVLLDCSGDAVAQPFDSDHVVFTRNVLGHATTKLVPPGLVMNATDASPASLTAQNDTSEVRNANFNALIKFIQHAVLDGHLGPAHGGAFGHLAGNLLRALHRRIEQHLAGNAPSLTFPELIEALQLAQSKYRQALEVKPGSALMVMDAAGGNDESVIAFEALARSTPAASSSTAQLGTMSVDEATRKYFAARATIRDSRHRLVTQPNYDVHDVFQKLLEIGQSGHQPMAYVTAADLVYYGAVPRTPESWRVAMRLYHMAAKQGAVYAHVGLGDLLYFQLVEDPTTVRSRDEVLASAAEQYELAQVALADPSTRALLEPHEIARVDCGLGDVLFERAQIAADEGDVHLSEGLLRRARAHYHEAKNQDPRAKRAFARLALFALYGYGGEARSMHKVSMYLASARSVDNPARELAARTEMLAAIDNEEALAACYAEMEACITPEH